MKDYTDRISRMKLTTPRQSPLSEYVEEGLKFVGVATVLFLFAFFVYNI